MWKLVTTDDLLRTTYYLYLHYLLRYYHVPGHHRLRHLEARPGRDRRAAAGQGRARLRAAEPWLRRAAQGMGGAAQGG